MFLLSLFLELYVRYNCRVLMGKYGGMEVLRHNDVGLKAIIEIIVL